MATAQDQSGLSDTSLAGALAPYGGSAPLDSSPVIPSADPTPSASTPVSSSTPPASSSSGNWWDTITSLPSTLLGGLDKLTGGNAGVATGAAAGLYEANQAKQANAALAKPLTDVSTPLLNSGLDQLGKYQQLTPLQNSALTSATSTGATLTGEADPLLGIGKTAMSDYTAGKLPQWQQAQLDAKIAQAKALARQSLGANVDSTTLAQIDAQIESQAMQTQGALLGQNLATGEQAYKQGTDLQQQGGADTVAGYRAAVTDVNNNLRNALDTITAGLGPLEESIKLQIAGNTALTGQLQALFGALAKSMNTGSAAAGGSSGGGALSGALGKVVNPIISKIFGSGATGAFTPGLTSAIDAASAGVGTDVASSLAGLTDSSFAAASPGIDAAIQGGLDQLPLDAAPVAADVAATGADAAAGSAESLGAWGAGAEMLGAAALPFIVGELNKSKMTAPNPITGQQISEGDPGWGAVSAFDAPGVAAETASLTTDPMQAMGLYDQYMSGGASGSPLGALPGQPQGTSYAQLVKDYIAQGGDPSKILPQYRQYIGA